MPDFGIGEGLAALFGGGDVLAGLFGGGEAAAGLAGADAAAAGLLAGPTVAGTAFDFLAPDAATGLSAAFGGGPTAFGTAADTLAAPTAFGGADALGPSFGAAADVAAGQAGASGLASGVSGIQAAPSIGDLVPSAFGGTSSSLSPGVANANAFDTGVPATPASAGTPATAPGTIPATGGSGGAAGFSGPTGTGSVDPTAALGPTSVNGAPLSGQTGVTPVNPTPSGIDQLLGKLSPSNLATGAVDSIVKNPLPTALAGGGLAYNILQGQKNTKNQQALTNDANIATANSNTMVASGEALQQYLTNGTLPPAYQTQVDNAIADAKTNAISAAAAQGQSTDPTQNTALAATLAKIDASRATMQTQVASQLFQSGSSLVNSGAAAAGLSGQLFTQLVQNDTTQAANTGKAIATLAAALNGKSQASAGGQTITIG